MTPIPTHLFSASQITLFRECERKWALRYLAGLVSEQTKAQALGDEIDSGQLQPFLRDGREFDFTKESGHLAAAALAYLPKPQSPGLEVQKHFLLPALEARRPDGSALWGYQGYIDLWLPNGMYMLPPLPAPSEGFPVVGDFKSTRDLKWAKTSQALSTDVQAQLYSFWSAFSTRKAHTDLVWIYFQTAGARRVKRVHYRSTAEHSFEQFKSIDATAARMFELVQSHHRMSCADEPIESKQFALDLTPNVDMCEEYGGCPYRHECNLSPEQTIAAKAAKDTRLIQLKRKDSEPSMDANALLAKLRGETTVSPSSEQSTSKSAEQSSPSQTSSSQVVLGVNPPEAGLPPAPPVSTAKKTATPRAKATTVASVTSNKKIRALYINAWEVGVSATPAEALYELVRDRIQKAHGVPDYRLIDFKGAGVFADTLRGVIEERETPLDAVYLDTNTPEGALAKTVMVFNADRVIGGMR